MKPAAALVSVLLILAFGASAIRARAADDLGARVDIVALRHSEAALRATYASDKTMNLPRLLLFDGDGKPLLIEFGMRDGVGRRLAKALEKAKPLSSPVTLAMVLGEVVDANGIAVASADLPRADGYVVDYWASWCTPCHLLARDIEGQLRRWDGRHIVWLKIESDPEQLPKEEIKG
ncbi:MAG: hypothetical protein ABI843_09245 [Dokdonella sp.]